MAGAHSICGVATAGAAHCRLRPYQLKSSIRGLSLKIANLTHLAGGKSDTRHPTLGFGAVRVESAFGNLASPFSPEALVIGLERRMLLRHYLETGMSKRAIARKLKISPDTLYRWIREADLDRDIKEFPVQYGPRPPVPTKLDPYKLLIQVRLDAFPALSSVRLFEEVQASGYTGGYTQLKEYVRSIRPRPEPEPIIRFGTPPAHQAQVNFAKFKFPWGKRFALLVVLGYSHLLWLRFYPKQDMRTLFMGLEEALGFFGCLPRVLLFDQWTATGFCLWRARRHKTCSLLVGVLQGGCVVQRDSASIHGVGGLPVRVHAVPGAPGSCHKPMARSCPDEIGRQHATRIVPAILELH